MRELEKAFNPKEMEDKIYKRWENKGYFHAHINPDKKPYTIVMPPPNITGQLHMGHAFDETIQDILIRFKRMQGYEVLWQPGTDHASIATEAKVVESMRAEGLTKDNLGREKFLERCFLWREKYGSRIVTQLKKMGSSCDWGRERFTMDEGCSKAVLKVFTDLYKKDLIYRGSRIVNWCPYCHTSISDAEVEYEAKEGNFYHILYPVKETGDMLEVATTRPETMFGDTAVAVNADDPRYKKYIGMHVKLPLTDREISIIADEHADMEKGTGVVKITPAHDPNDFEVGKRHNLPSIRVFTYEGILTGKEEEAYQKEFIESGKAAEGEPYSYDCGKYAGMDVLSAREEVIKDLKELGLLKSIEPITHDVGTCYRCKHVIEPMISRQWFVRMKPLAEPAIKAVKDGEIRFVPDRFAGTYLNWMENTRDWCISRQLWWGHRIPAWYCEDCGEMIVSAEPITECPKCHSKKMNQDPDTLDTWFSSALWPFSTLGWPEKTPEYDYFYPTNTLVTGYDIIGFWVSRMIFSGLAYTGKIPFDTVYIHGMVRDSQGRKMSKSLGNGIDPLEVIDQYGCDALRMMLLMGNAAGNDMRYHEEKVEASRNFTNKIWNAARFIMMNLEKAEIPENVPENLTDSDKWILSKCNTLIRDVTENMEKFELGIALTKIYDFTWDEFCDWYIEMVKPRLYSDDDTTKGAALWTLRNVLTKVLKLLHPYIPFVTEEIYLALFDTEESIMITDWPLYDEGFSFKTEENTVEVLKEAIRSIRQIRTEKNVPNSQKTSVYVVSSDANVRDLFTRSVTFFRTLSYASEILIRDTEENIPPLSVSSINSNHKIFIPLTELVDMDKEKERLTKEEERLLNEIERAKNMLSNERFLAKAPEAKVAEEKEKLAKYENMLNEVKKQLLSLNS